MLETTQLAGRSSLTSARRRPVVFAKRRVRRGASLPVSDRALAVLNALLSFHPDTVLTAGAADLVVFPSNRGLVLRRDSPNGKRYARKATSGDIEQAFGFDLGPIVARADEFAALAEAAIARRQGPLPFFASG